MPKSANYNYHLQFVQDHEFIPTRSSGILASKPAANPGQFTRINSNPLLISAQKQMLLVDEAKKKKKEQERKQIVGDDTPDWQSVSDKNLVRSISDNIRSAPNDSTFVLSVSRIFIL